MKSFYAGATNYCSHCPSGGHGDLPYLVRCLGTQEQWIWSVKSHDRTIDVNISYEVNIRLELCYELTQREYFADNSTQAPVPLDRSHTSRAVFMGRASHQVGAMAAIYPQVTHKRQPPLHAVSVKGHQRLTDAPTNWSCNEHRDLGTQSRQLLQYLYFHCRDPDGVQVTLN